MVALETPRAMTGWRAADFTLPATDGKHYGLNEVAGENGLLVVFMCNHCPYVQKQIARIEQTAQALRAMGIATVAINSNDATKYPEDSFEAMQAFAAEHQLSFPYLHDETQQIAKAYGAVCTPDFFGFAADLSLQYRGRLDASWSGLLENPQQELLLAMQEVAETGRTERPQNPSIGCSIKWRVG